MQMDFRPNERVGGYRLVRELGRGGMGVVYEVEHVDLGVRSAMKAFTLDHGNREFLRKRFLAEAKMLARLDHPRLVKVRDLAVDPSGGFPYFVMDLVLNAAGEPETLEDARKAGKVTEDAALAWYDDLREGLAYIHAQGIVHRDVKLENVLVDAEGRSVLSDFGVSRIFDERVRTELMVTTTFVEGETTGTRPVMGTYWYLAPEVRKGGAATAASDWYALGVLLFRLLTGMWYEPNTKAFDLLAPFSKECQRVVRRLLSDDPSARVPTVIRSRTACRSVFGWTAGVIVLAGVLFAIRHSLCPHSPPVSPSPFSLHYCDGVDFRFQPCPEGTNSCGKTLIAVTRPYWLSEVPVTRRDWCAVLETELACWEGGDRAPVTYMTRDEADGFCRKLTQRFREELPDGYEIRLPTVAEWRLAYQFGRTETNTTSSSRANWSRENCATAWFGQGAVNMRNYYEDHNLPVPMVTNVWPEFPPVRLDSKDAGWVRLSSHVAPVPVGLKPANGLGLRDMRGNCFEMMADCGVTNANRWGGSEFGMRANNPYAGLPPAVTNPVVRSGSHPLMLGNYMTPDLHGDDVWVAPFDRLPHLGFRLCLGPKLSVR